MSDPQILLVEDNPATRKLLRRTLEAESYRVTECSDASSALLAAREQTPDLILQDIVLPDMDGFELARNLRQTRGAAEVPIVAITGLVSHTSTALLARGGFSEVLLKPFKPSHLMEVVKKYLPPSSRPAQVGERKLVLLVDDDPAQLHLIALHLRDRGFRVNTARDGLEGFASAKAERPDAILSDVMMPRADGFTLCQLVRDDDRLRAVPVVLVSGHYDEPADEALALKMGADALMDRRTPVDAIVDGLAAAIGHDRGLPFAVGVEGIEGERRASLERQLERQIRLNEKQTTRCALHGGIATIMRRLAEVLARHSNPLQALEETLYTVLDVAGSFAGAIYLRDGTGWKVASQIGVAGEADQALRQTVLPTLLIRGREFVALKAGDPDAELLQTLDARSAVLVPLIARQVQVGALLIAFKTLDGVDEDRVELARMVGLQLAHTVSLGEAFAAVEQSQRKYQALFQGAHDAVVLLTREGVVVDLNRSAEELLGVPKSGQLGHSIRDFAAPGQEAANDASFRKGLEGERVSAQLKRSDGAIRSVEWSVAPIEIDGEQQVLSIGRDVTEAVEARAEQKRLEQQILQAQKLEAVGQLTGGVAHDFNNILAVIMMNGQCLLESLGPEDPLREVAGEIMDSSQRAAALTRQLLAFSRRQVLEPTVVSLDGLIANLGKMLVRLIGEDIELEIVSAPALWSVRVDPGQIEQVLMNLVVNARDAMPSGGKLMIETSNVELDAAYAAGHPPLSPGRYVRVAVSDTGTGMDAETQRHAFEPFFTTKAEGKGTGLGLSTSYGIVRQSGGAISLESKMGHGTLFTIDLPEVAEAPEPRVRAPSPGRDPRGTETILLVEDDPAVRTTVSRTLSERGYRVLTARDGPQALELFEGHQREIRLVLSDVIVPGLSGPNVVDQITHSLGPVRALFMSGYTDQTILRNGALPAGMNFIQKPFTATALAIKVREVLDRPEPAPSDPGTTMQEEPDGSK